MSSKTSDLLREILSSVEFAETACAMLSTVRHAEEGDLVTLARIIGMARKIICSGCDGRCVWGGSKCSDCDGLGVVAFDPTLANDVLRS